MCGVGLNYIALGNNPRGGGGHSRIVYVGKFVHKSEENGCCFEWERDHEPYLR